MFVCFCLCFGSTILKIFWEKIRTRGANFNSCPGRQTPTLRPWVLGAKILKFCLLRAEISAKNKAENAFFSKS